MSNKTFYGSYNARWMNPTEVANSFVPLPQFRQLTHSGNSILLGPRGCGKTTLLKMLTPQALKTWHERHVNDKNSSPFENPDFFAIYIPADARWLYEIENIENCLYFIETEEVEVIQRVLVAASSMHASLSAVQSLCRNLRLDEKELCTRIIKSYDFRISGPNFEDIIYEIAKIPVQLKAAINFKKRDKVNHIIENLSPFFISHILEAPLELIRVVNQVYEDEIPHNKWALCFDEVEISPDWMRQELFESLRSLENQNVLLKLTCSPLLPTGLSSAPNAGDDFTAIRLWHSHIPDADDFCTAYTSQFLSGVSSDEVRDTSPDIFFLTSPFAEDKSSVKSKTSYERGSHFYELMQELAEYDKSFRKLLESKHFDPADPFSESVEVRDSFFRKIKPLAMLRSEFLDERMKKKHRKSVSLYAGKEAIYSQSEGNPRWLKGILTDLYDAWKSDPTYNKDKQPYIEHRVQRVILNSVSRRFEAFLKSTPVLSNTPIENNYGESLHDFIEILGNAFKDRYLGQLFTLDPVGSIKVDPNVSQRGIDIIKKAVGVGALVYIGKSPQDVARNIVGERFRISFMLASIYRLPFRTYRETSLTTLLDSRHSAQTNLFSADFEEV